MSDKDQSDTRELVELETQRYDLERTRLQLAVQQEMSMRCLSDAMSSISTWLTGGGLEKTLGEFARATGANAMMQGLVAHDGRHGLDARTITQNATEIVYFMEAVRDKFQEHLQAKNAGEERDPDLHDAEADFKKFKEDGKTNSTDS